MAQFRIETKYDQDHIQQRLLLDHGGLNPVEEISRQMISLRDKHVISALVNLGWTPPTG